LEHFQSIPALETKPRINQLLENNRHQVFNLFRLTLYFLFFLYFAVWRKFKPHHFAIQRKL